MRKPRPYDGAVAFLDAAHHVAEEWPDPTLQAVDAHFPYPPERGVRMSDWIELVAHVSTHKEEDPIQCAERLALYCQTYAERYRKQPLPATVMRSQTHDE